MSKQYNVTTRPRRAIHNRKLVITEELAKLFAAHPESESDEDFVPNSTSSKKNKDQSDDLKVVGHDESGSNTSDSNKEVEEESDEKSTISETDNDESELEDEKDNVENTLINETKSDITNDESNSATKDSNKNDEAKSTNKASKKQNKEPKKSIKRRNSNDSKNEEAKKRRLTSQKRANNKRKKLQKQKLDEINNENKKILEKISSRLKQTPKLNTFYNGPVVKFSRATIDNKNYPLYIISNSRIDSSNETVDVNSKNNLNKKKLHENTNEMNAIKIPKDKIPTIQDNTSPWLCILCKNRPNHYNLGDLYGPYHIKPTQLDDDDAEASSNTESTSSQIEAWIHENCAVWTPHVYVKDNKLHGLSQAVKMASKIVSYPTIN